MVGSEAGGRGSNPDTVSSVGSVQARNLPSLGEV